MGCSQRALSRVVKIPWAFVGVFASEATGIRSLGPTPTAQNLAITQGDFSEHFWPSPMHARNSQESRPELPTKWTQPPTFFYHPTACTERRAGSRARQGKRVGGGTGTLTGACGAGAIRILHPLHGRCRDGGRRRGRRVAAYGIAWRMLRWARTRRRRASGMRGGPARVGDYWHCLEKENAVDGRSFFLAWKALRFLRVGNMGFSRC